LQEQDGFSVAKRRGRPMISNVRETIPVGFTTIHNERDVETNRLARTHQQRDVGHYDAIGLGVADGRAELEVKSPYRRVRYGVVVVKRAVGVLQLLPARRTGRY